MISELFFDLIQVSLGNRGGLKQEPSAKEWSQLFTLASKQALTGVLLEGVNILQSTTTGVQKDLLLEWIGVQQYTRMKNKVLDNRAAEALELLKEWGYRSCILKGQGTARYYPNPENRQCGDIDIWVEGDRDQVLSFARTKGYEIPHIDIKHSDIVLFDDAPVEVHHLPSWMYCPSTNKKLQKFFQYKADKQFSNYDSSVGFAHSTIDFDLVYSMVHIYRHIFSEGIGLRQLMDYYYILSHSSKDERDEAFETLCGLRMKSFVGGVMWILRECFGMNEGWMICAANERHGRFLLSEIMIAGNFGHYDSRIRKIKVDKRFQRGLVQLKKNYRFLCYYPSEVLWSPFWKLWHWVWRKRKGYL